MIEYCVALKIGGELFDSLYRQIATMRIDLAKLINRKSFSGGSSCEGSAQSL
jgi:hypothetical protein